MIILYILAAICFIIFILLVTNINFSVLIDENFDYTLKFGLIKIISSRKKERAKTKISGQKDNSNLGYIKKLISEKGYSAAICQLFSYIKIVFSEIEYFISKIKIRKFICRITVAEGDAATTAISYGAISASVYSLVGLLDSSMDFQIEEISIKENYDIEKGSFYLNFTAKTKVLYLLIIAIKLLFKFINKRDVLSWEKTA